MSTLHYDRLGRGPALLLLHATLSSSRQLRPLAERLAEQHTVISVDRRGSGRNASPGPAAPIDVAVHVADLAVIVGTEDLGPVTVVGHSYGGCVALELAARRPDVVRAVFAYEPPYGPAAAPGAQTRMAQVGRRTLEARDRGDLEGAALAFMAGVSGPEAAAALSPRARARIARAGQGAVADATLLGMDLDGLSRIGCPVRLATGTASEPLYTDIARALASRIRGATVQHLEGLDHLAPVLRPDATARAIEQFIAP